MRDGIEVTSVGGLRPRWLALASASGAAGRSTRG